MSILTTQNGRLKTGNIKKCFNINIINTYTRKE